MADVVLCFASDGEAAAARLAQALSRDGYAIWSEEQSGTAPITDRIARVSAAIVLWSPAARSSEWVRAEANYARGQNKLIQASIDEAPPPMPFDAASVAPLAGWTGEEGHPGWRRIRSELRALCRPAEARRQPAPAAVAPQPSRDRRRGGGGRLAAGTAFLLLAAVGAFFWMRSGPPYATEGEPPSAATPAPAAAGRSPAAAPLPPAPVAIAPPPLPAESPQGAAEAAPQSRPAPRPSGPRINRRNSENMRLFCERAGRGTPQCRDFQRQLRNQAR